MESNRFSLAVPRVLQLLRAHLLERFGSLAQELERLGALMAVDREGVLRGVVTVEQVRRALQSAFGSLAA